MQAEEKRKHTRNKQPTRPPGNLSTTNETKETKTNQSKLGDPSSFTSPLSFVFFRVFVVVKSNCRNKKKVLPLRNRVDTPEATVATSSPVTVDIHGRSILRIRKRPAGGNAPAVPVLSQNESTVIHTNNLERGASCGPRSSCSLNWRREFRSLVPILGQLARIADNAPLFNYHSDNKYWDSLRGIVGCTPWKVERHSVIQTKAATVTFCHPA